MEKGKLYGRTAAQLFILGMTIGEAQRITGLSIPQLLSNTKDLNQLGNDVMEHLEKFDDSKVALHGKR